MNNNKKLLKYNESTYFLLPSFALTIRELESAGFVNSYLIHENVPKVKVDGVWIYLLFRTDTPNLQKKMAELIWQLRLKKVFVDHWGYDKDYWVVVLELYEEYEDDFVLFTEGRYSEFSQKFINTIPKEVTLLRNNQLVTVPSTMYQIITKEPAIKSFVEREMNTKINSDEEYWPAPDTMAKEVLWMEQFLRDKDDNEK
jgi:hypothetical protein